jgi:predicted ATPase
VRRATAALVRKSLLRVQQPDGAVGEAAAGEPRLRMPEMVREYAAELLHRSGEEPALRARHGAWCLALAEAADAPLRGAGQREWLDRLEAEHDNLRAALAWALGVAGRERLLVKCVERGPEAPGPQALEQGGLVRQPGVADDERPVRGQPTARDEWGRRRRTPEALAGRRSAGRRR